MSNWFTDTVLKTVVPRAVAALIALGVAHTDLLHSWGINPDWTTLSGKITTAVVLLVGLLAHHHVDQAVKGVTS